MSTNLTPAAGSSKGISGSTLKLIAITTMFLDHIGAAILENGRFIGYATADGSLSLQTLRNIDLILRLIGRVAFPIFCFLLVEGFLHTRNVKKYALRLGMFCFLSELPFDLAFSGSLVSMRHQNVFFTLFIGLLVLIGLRHFGKNSGKDRLMRILCILAGILAAIVLKTDYHAFGVCILILFYQFRANPLLRDITTMLSLILLSPLELTGLFALIPIHLYNGTRGISLKYFFYLFYPLHLLLLIAIRELLLLGIF